MEEQTTAIPCISLWQPWASLLIWGHKNYETRAWPWPELREGDLPFVGIHAACNRNREAARMCDEEPFISILDRHAVRYATMPRGVLLGVMRVETPSLKTGREKFCPPYPECEFGDYAPRRWATRLHHVHTLSEPVAMRGYQKFWSAMVPITWLGKDFDHEKYMAHQEAVYQAAHQPKPVLQQRLF